MAREDERAAALIAPHLHKGCMVAIGDGVSAVELGPALAEAARSVGGIELLLGWCLSAPIDLDDVTAFPRIRTFMGGYALRDAIGRGRVKYLPVRLGALPALLAGPLKPDVLLLGARPDGEGGGVSLTTEAAWLPAAAENATSVLVEVNDALPRASAEPPFDRGGVTALSEVSRAPMELEMAPARGEALARLGANAAALIPSGSAIQFGPGPVADAILDALEVPVHVDSGVITDAVVGLEQRELLLSTPTAAYVTGSANLYRWCDGQPITRRIEHTHDVTRLSSRPFVAINTALEIDLYAQVNVERAGGAPIGGIGGHGDYAIAASRSAGGLSMVALPQERGGHTTLVEQLSAPASTAYADVDVVVTEAGVAELRGLDPRSRARAVRSLWR